MQTTFTRSATDSFTESRARYVLGKICDDFNGIFFRGFTRISADDLKKWRDDIQYVMERNALEYFELQFTYEDQEWIVRYEVRKNGEIVRDDESGGLDFYNIPAAATFNIVLRRDTTNQDVTDYLSRRGWESGGRFQGDSGNHDRSYSKD